MNGIYWIGLHDRLDETLQEVDTGMYVGSPTIAVSILASEPETPLQLQEAGCRGPSQRARGFQENCWSSVHFGSLKKLMSAKKRSSGHSNRASDSPSSRQGSEAKSKAISPRPPFTRIGTERGHPRLGRVFLLLNNRRSHTGVPRVHSRSSQADNQD